MIKSFINQKLPFTGITIGYMAILLILSAIPGSYSPDNQLMPVTPLVQNLAHMPAYGFLVLLWMFNLRTFGVSKRHAVMAAMIIATVYGLLMELLQMSMPGRFPSIMDCLLNVAGILMITACYLIFSSQGSITSSRSGLVRSRL